MFEVLQSNLKQQLEKKSISVAELERRTGLRHAVINIMRGRSKNPSIKIAHALAVGLGCSIEDLITETNISNGICTKDNKQDKSESALINLTDPNSKKKLGEYNRTLGTNIFNAINNILDNKNISLTPDKVMELWLESYNYCSGIPGQSIDKRFIEWLIDRG